MTSSNHDASTGTIAFRVRNETFYTWYTIFGKLKTDLRPLVVLHGGLGMSHDYVLPHSDLSVRSGRPVILYDQIGNGQSSRLKGKRPDLFSFDLFLDELDNLLDHFGITNGFDLLGHSWGGYLAIEFAARRQPPGLKNLVLVGTAASKALWNKGVGRLMDRMPEYVKEGLLHAESSDACKEAKQEFYKSHMCTLDPWPEELNKSFTYEEDDATVHTMMRPILMRWTCVDSLHNIAVPTLLINSPNDLAQDIGIKPLFVKIPRVKWIHLPRTSHTPFLEDREEYMRVVDEFLAV